MKSWKPSGQLNKINIYKSVIVIAVSKIKNCCSFFLLQSKILVFGIFEICINFRFYFFSSLWFFYLCFFSVILYLITKPRANTEHCRRFCTIYLSHLCCEQVQLLKNVFENRNIQICFPKENIQYQWLYFGFFFLF